MNKMAELQRWRSAWQEYRRWLAEFPLVAMTLDNMNAEVEGLQLDVCYPPQNNGPWGVDGLRYKLRQLSDPRDQQIAALTAERDRLLEQRHELLGKAERALAGWNSEMDKREKVMNERDRLREFVAAFDAWWSKTSTPQSFNVVLDKRAAIDATEPTHASAVGAPEPSA